LEGRGLFSAAATPYSAIKLTGRPHAAAHLLAVLLSNPPFPALPCRLLPYLPPALEVLLYAEADATDVADVLQLLNQLMLRFEDGLAPLMAEMVPACMARVHSLLPADWDWSGAKATPAALSTPTAAATAAAAAGGGGGDSRPAGGGSTEDLRERAELQRAYYAFAHSLVHNGLVGVLLRVPRGSLDAILGALMRGAASHVDPGVRKTCIQTVGRLAGEWCSAEGGEALPGFREFVMKQVGGGSACGWAGGCAGLMRRGDRCTEQGELAPHSSQQLMPAVVSCWPSAPSAPPPAVWRGCAAGGACEQRAGHPRRCLHLSAH
jgi:hypothetical protein